jgi:hypothetical protein
MRTINKRGAVRFCTLLVLSSIAMSMALAQKGTNVERRITFPRGQSSTNIRGFIADRMTTHEYKIKAKAGQTLSAQFSSPRTDVDMCVSYPPGSDGPENPCGRTFTGTLPVDGDYSIIVDSKREKTSYSIAVSVR